MIDGTIPSIASAHPTNPDAFLTDLSEDIWESARRPLTSGPYQQRAWKIAEDVCMMQSVGMNRRARRLSNGALVLNREKITFKRDEHGNPIDIGLYTIRESNQLVEEYMLLANYLVAEELLHKCGNAAFLRGHPSPSIENKGMTELIQLARVLEIPINVESAQGLQESLNRISSNPSHKSLLPVISTLLMHPMEAAEYMVAGTHGPSSWKHFALSIPYYTHFTSPIRRYADVTVHRLLQLALTNPEAARSVQGSQPVMDELRKVADQCNVMKMASKSAQERSDRVFLTVYLQSHPMYVEAVVIGVGPKSFTVLIPSLSIEERIFIDKMPGVTANFDSTTETLVLTRAESSIGVAAVAAADNDDRDCKSSIGSSSSAVFAIPEAGNQQKHRHSHHVSKGIAAESKQPPHLHQYQIQQQDNQQRRQPQHHQSQQRQQHQQHQQQNQDRHSQGNRRADRADQMGTLDPEIQSLAQFQTFSTLEVKMLTRIIVYLTGSKRPPINVQITVVGVNTVV